MRDHSKPEITGRKQAGQFAPGVSGNPSGKPKGSRHRTTVMAEKLMTNEAKAVVQAVIDAAKDGDMTAARLVLDRIAPARKGRPVSLDLPEVKTSADLADAMAAVFRALSEGAVTPDEATAIAGVFEIRRRAIETVEFEARLQALEAKGADQ